VEATGKDEQASASNQQSMQTQTQTEGQPNQSQGRPASGSISNHPAFAFHRQMSARAATRKEQAGPIAGICSLLITWGITIGLCAYEIYLWVTYQNTPCEYPLTKWMAASGISGLINLAISNYISCVIPGEPDEQGQSKRRKHWDSIFQAFSLCIFIWGATWLYGIDKDHHYCPDQVYMFMFVLYCISWALLGLVLLICICLICVGIAKQGR